MAAIFWATVVVLFYIAPCWLIAQQLPQQNMYLMNHFLVNPAAGGTKNYVDIKVATRQQWTGIDGSPRTYVVSACTPHHITEKRKKHPENYHSGGAYVLHDGIGVFQRTGFYAAYGYHFLLGRDVLKSVRASAGMAVGMNSWSLNNQAAILDNPNDPLLKVGITDWTPDMNFGLWFYNLDFYAGFAVNQLVGFKLPFGENGTLQRHYVVTAGYRWWLNNDISFTPSTLLKFTAQKAFHIDLNLIAKYSDIAWAGASYRTTGVAAFAGFDIAQHFDLTYAIEFPTTVYQAGLTHEVIMALKLGNARRDMNKKNLPLYD